MASHITKLIEQMFKDADQDDSGTLRKAEVCKALKNAGDDRDYGAITDWFEKVPKKEPGIITLEELQAALQSDDNIKLKYRILFRGCDSDGDGRVTIQELKKVVRDNNIDWDAIAKHEEMDTNQDGKLSFQEFYRSLTGNDA